MPDLIALSQELIQRQSITPDDCGCQQLIAEILQPLGFQIQHQRFEDVDNFFAWHGESDGGLLFLGHTDVVPTGDPQQWKHSPFAATLEDDYLFGRGAADMKGSVAAMVCALVDFVKKYPNHDKKIAIMLTSDEEGPAQNGIKKMMPLINKTHKFDHCLVGEPSSSKVLGDVVRMGRRGSLHVKIVVHGVQGHVAYPEKAVNPVFQAAPLIADLDKTQWDEGLDEFPPTSFQISSVQTSTQTANIIPGELTIKGNFRYSPKSTQKSLEKTLLKLIKSHQLQCELEWTLSGEPFHNRSQTFKQALCESLLEVTGQNPEFNAGGGTSDGRFVAPFGINVMELGPVNATIHKIDECVKIQDLEQLKSVYFKVLQKLNHE